MSLSTWHMRWETRLTLDADADANVRWRWRCDATRRDAMRTLRWLEHSTTTTEFWNVATQKTCGWAAPSLTQQWAVSPDRFSFSFFCCFCNTLLHIPTHVFSPYVCLRLCSLERPGRAYEWLQTIRWSPNILGTAWFHFRHLNRNFKYSRNFCPLVFFRNRFAHENSVTKKYLWWPGTRDSHGWKSKALTMHFPLSSHFDELGHNCFRLAPEAFFYI